MRFPTVLKHGAAGVLSGATALSGATDHLHGHERAPEPGFKPASTVAVASAPTVAGSTVPFGKGFPAV
jgi:hypothetical protein